jgi:glycosyltransferase involved in cell wall biosynthesis
MAPSDEESLCVAKQGLMNSHKSLLPSNTLIVGNMEEHWNSQHEDEPLRVMFVHTSLTMGGEEVLLVEIIRRMNRARCTPELCCLKERGPLGADLADEGIPVFDQLMTHKYDIRVWQRLTHLFRERKIDAVVTVGTGGDKMFWGRLAAWRANVPVIVSSIHSTGWPIRVEWVNRRLAPMTDAFIAVAEKHGEHIIEHEGCPREKVCVIPNGVDIDIFQPQERNVTLRAELGLPADAPVAGLVAVIREEKNHGRFLRVARAVHEQLPTTHFLLVGAGPELPDYEQMARDLGIGEAVHFVGRRTDIPALLSELDLFLLTSDMEASPVSILEAMACGLPVVSTRVGSISETIADGVSGYLVEKTAEDEMAARVTELLTDPQKSREMGNAGRQRVVAGYSVERMVEGYEDLLTELHECKRPVVNSPAVV